MSSDLQPSRFVLPSLGVRGHANPHNTGRVSLSFMYGPMLQVDFGLRGLTPDEAREIAAALKAAADAADIAQAESKARIEEAMTRRGQ